MPGLAALFFLTALLYGAAGFGGGSTYNALLVLAGTDYRAVPVIALACNILVVTVGSWRFARSGHVDWRRIWPLFVLSIPFAWLGGRLVVAEMVFVGLLAASLLVAGLLMLWQPLWEKEAPATVRSRWLEPVGGRRARLPRRNGRDRRRDLPRALALHAALGAAQGDRGDQRGLHPRQFAVGPRGPARQGQRRRGRRRRSPPIGRSFRRCWPAG